ncbi:MAG TPA: hypothetical protein VJ997_13485 [Longimicrobiales bacterium]|nr:hypothetical protein [Longimicrobiales bacterium]
MRRVVRRTRTRVPEYTSLGCPLTKSRTSWCHGVCAPVDGRGVCGRLAPHALIGRTQEAIYRHKIQRAGAAAL